MGTDDDVRFICYFDGKLSDEDTNAKYKGGTTKLINLPKSIGFSSFKQKIQEITKLPTQFKIKCGVKVDESTLIAVDVDDDDSLQSVMEVSKYVRTYILKDVPPATTVTAPQREYLVLPLAATLSQAKVPILPPRLNAFIAMDIPELGGRIDLDGFDNRSNGGDLNELAKLADWEQWINLSVSNHEGINSSRIDKYEKSLLNIHEHSEGSEVNKPEKMHAKVDNHQITVSISSHSSTLDNMLYTTNQVSSQVCSGSSVHYELTNSLIRNHEDNEADELHMQENMVHKEIQCTFQRKETITSGHKPAPISTHDRLDTSVRFPNSNVVLLDKGMTNMAVSNHEINEGNEDMVHKEYGYTGQAEQIVHPSDAAIDICFGVGKEFPDIDALKNALCDMAIMTGREYKPVKTSPSELKMKCNAADCNWRLHATCSSNSHVFRVNRYQEEHTCMVRTNNGDEDHPQATVKWIASKVQSSIEENLDMEPAKIINEIKDKFRIKITTNKAMKAKNEVKEGIRKHIKESLPAPDTKVCHLLVEELKRGGSVADLGVNPIDGSFEYFFWAFSVCIHALRTHLRPVLFIRTEDIAIGILMCAYGVDGNSYRGDRLEVGFAVFAREDDKAWETFVCCLKKFVLPPTDNNNLPFAIVTNFKDTAILAIQNDLPDIHHFFFTDDFSRVFSEKFKGGSKLRNLCECACIFFSAEKCSEYLKDIKKMNEEAYEWLLQRTSQCSAGFSPNKHVMSENSVFRSDHFKLMLEKLSIVEIVEGSRDMLAEEFSRRQKATIESSAPRIMHAMHAAKSRLSQFEVEPINGGKYQVTNKFGSILREDQTEVDLEKRSCTCREFQAMEYPCTHAWVTAAHLNSDPRDYVTHRWYGLVTYQATYAGSLPSPIPKDISPCQTTVAGFRFYPIKDVQAGRPKKIQRKD